LFSDGIGARVELLGAGEVANFAADTTISPYFPSGLPAATTTFYDIIVANNGSKIVDNATLVSPSNMAPGLVLKKSLVEDDRILRISFEDTNKPKDLIISSKDTSSHKTSNDGNITITEIGSIIAEGAGIVIDTPETTITNAGKIDVTSSSIASAVTVGNKDSGGTIINSGNISNFAGQRCY